MKILDMAVALTWRDALDFALLFALFYAVLRLLRGTRATPILAGVAFVALVAFAADTIELVAVASVLRYFLQYAILILIVVFNHELRRILVRLGQRVMPWSWQALVDTWSRKPSDPALVQALAELVTGLERLILARAGALVVIERQAAVLAHCGDSGRPIDAALKADTLVALSLPHVSNPAHDGAILIQGGKIARAGVICPLAETVPDLRFGTRHRGALGISEETDAVVVVLSEQRSELRVVMAGQLSEPLASAELLRVLERELLPREHATNRLRATTHSTANQPSLSRTDIRSTATGVDASSGKAAP